MRLALAATILLAALASRAAAEPALVDVEVRAGYGVEVGGGGGAAVVRPSAMTIGARVAYAIYQEPATWAYVGGMTEAGGHSSAGLVAGVRLVPGGGSFHLEGGGLWIMAPYSLYGAIASAGICTRAKASLHPCLDLEATVLVAGDDLSTGRPVTQWQLVLGMRFDAM
jgi:hypothetical protein